MNTLKNNFYEIKQSQDFQINQDVCLNFLDINAQDEIMQINFELLNTAHLVVNFTVLNFANYTKSISLNVLFKAKNCTCEVNLSCLGLDQSHTNLAVNGICHMSLHGGLKIKINGVLDSDHACIVGHPNFLFDTHKIDAHHSLVIGGVNPQELNYLQSRKLKKYDAKFLLISAKLFSCLQYLQQSEIEHYQNLILNYWRQSHAKH